MGCKKSGCKATDEEIGRCKCGYWWCKKHAWLVKGEYVFCPGCAR